MKNIPRIASTLVTLALMLTANPARVIAADTAKPSSSPASDAKPSQSAASKMRTSTPMEQIPIERRPYRIQVDFSFDPSTRIDAARRAELIGGWEMMVRRFVGAPWDIKVIPKASPLSGTALDAITTESFASVGEDFDKYWLIRVALEPAGEGIRLTGREFDRGTRRLGSIHGKSATVLAELPRVLLAFSLELFNPVAVISGETGGRALLTVQGAALSASSPVGAVVGPGTIFIPLRITTTRDGKPSILRIPYTYLKVESVTGAIARCDFVKGIADPLSKRWSRPFTFAAIGIKPGDTPLRLRFMTTKDKREVPVAGYVLTTREVPDGTPREVGATDRGGRITIAPRFSRNLVMVRLVAGSNEPLFDAPMMPGESSDERVIPVRLLPQAVTLETSLESLRDEVVDLVAQRARLEARMKARLEGENWAELEQSLKEFQSLTPRDSMDARLKESKELAIKQQTDAKVPVLTRSAKAHIDELQALIDRYLDDDGINAYRDALAQGKSHADAESKSRAQTKTKLRDRVKAEREAAIKADEEKAALAVPVPTPSPPAKGAMKATDAKSAQPTPKKDETKPAPKEKASTSSTPKKDEPKPAPTQAIAPAQPAPF